MPRPVFQLKPRVVFEIGRIVGHQCQASTDRLGRHRRSLTLMAGGITAR